MRVSLAGQWLRAAHSDPPSRRTNLRYAFGVSVCMLGWLVVLVLPGPWQTVGFVVMVIAELSVPILAERHGSTTTWHPHHIAERYGLFTLIVLGESVLAATTAVQTAVDAGQAFGDLVVIAGGGLLVVFSMWWVYFAAPTEEPVTETGVESFRWGYGHYVVFASAAAVGAGLATAVDQATDPTVALSASRRHGGGGRARGAVPRRHRLRAGPQPATPPAGGVPRGRRRCARRHGRRPRGAGRRRRAGPAGGGRGADCAG